jgi:hypothetical protein
MYRVRVDTHTREDITAAVAAHRDLGRDYDDAVAEGLVERIGAEVDRRVDARLGQRAPQPPAVSSPARSAWFPLVMGLGSIGIGALASTALLRSGGVSVQPGGAASSTTVQPGQVLLVALIWIVIAVINVAYARRH